MKTIPAVTKEVVVTPERVVLEVGDRVIAYDNSYLHLLKANEHNTVRWDNSHYETDGICGYYVTILEMNLRVPVMECHRKKFGHKKYANEKNVYLDTMVVDDGGNIFLTCLKFLGHRHHI